MKKVIVIGFFSLALFILSGCSTNATVINVPSNQALIEKACKNLPNILIWESWDDVYKPWEVSLNAFGALVREDPKYLEISNAASIISDTIGPFYSGTKESESVDSQVQLINSFCAGLGTLTPRA